VFGARIHLNNHHNFKEMRISSGGRTLWQRPCINKDEQMAALSLRGGSR
jgi:hypothetical protein